MSRRSATSGAEWEGRYGYRRAVRIGDVIAVSGTTAPGPDATAQATAAFRIALAALAELGGTPADVVRTRMFVTDIADAEAVGRAHAQAFGDHPPAATVVEVSALVAPELRVEVELDAVVTGEGAA
ncbi:Rid family hydrolase [Rubrivirga sp.]|uniref:Rid family hydrolase n=1 Tax=Rubrivirga sp. TaxID=1885344 RepID=UPI003B530313